MSHVQSHSHSALADAYKRAGGDSSAALLHSIAVDMLKKHNRSPSKAATPFTEEVRDAGGILVALMQDRLSFAAVRTVALAYLEVIAADMKGPKSSGGVQSSIDGLSIRGPSGNNTVSPSGDGGVHLPGDSQADPGAPEKSEDERVRHRLDGLKANGHSPSPDNRNGAVLAPCDGHGKSGRVVPAQNKPRSLEAMKIMKRRGTSSIYDTLMIRSRPIGDIAFGELSTMISTSKRETALLTLIREHAQVQPASMKVREVISLKVLQRMVQKASEVSDAI